VTVKRVNPSTQFTGLELVSSFDFNRVNAESFTKEIQEQMARVS